MMVVLFCTTLLEQLLVLLLLLPLSLLLRLLFLLFAFLFLHDDHILIHLLLIVEVLIVPSILYLNVGDQEILKGVWPAEMKVSKRCI